MHGCMGMDGYMYVCTYVCICMLAFPCVFGVMLNSKFVVTYWCMSSVWLQEHGSVVCHGSMYVRTCYI